MPVKVNTASIRNKLISYMESPQYKKDMKEKISQLRKSGKDGDEIGLDIVSITEMEEAMQALIGLLRSYSGSLPPSVAAHFDVLAASSISINAGDTGATGYVSFGGDLSRPSLTAYTLPVDLPGQSNGHAWHNMNAMGYSGGGGIDDIVMMFNTGYHASSRVFGYSPGEGFIASLQDRPALGFLESAIDAFNAQYGAFAHASL